MKIDFAKLKLLPVGNGGWDEFSQTYYTVDKTLLIKELIDDQTTVALFTRPRRFGKTTALQTIKMFFEKASKDTSFLFRDKKIWAAGEGRYDIALFPLVPNFPGVIIEIKAAESETDDLKALAQEARNQIETKQYAAEMSAQGLTDVLKLGLVFYKKGVELAK